jgi:hypothetical protein
MKGIFYITLFISFGSFGQGFQGGLQTTERLIMPPQSTNTNIVGGVGRIFEELPSDEVIDLSIKTHNSIKPVIRIQPKRAPLNRNYAEINGLVDWNYLKSTTTDYQLGQYKLGAGAEFESYLNGKWFFRLAAVQGLHETDSLYNPKSYFQWQKGKTNYYTDIRSRISYTPNHIFNFQAGLDHNFIGEGSRSMFLDDYGKPYPFAMIRARFWRLEYSILYQFMREGQHKDWEGKFASSHHISFNAAKWLNIGVFETVVFQPKDTLLHRGFDAEYLNPMVFYRPQEYSIGSSDNVLLGIEASAKWKQHTAYFQFIIDEFFLAEIRARSGWWANKFGGQLGVKGRFQKGNHKFFYRAETNFSRPFTYSHISEELNYGNQGTPLAHVYGSNFAEILGELKWEREKWGANFFTNYSFHGSDKDGFNYGADIYQPYINRPFELGHFIGSGIQRNFFRTQLTVNYSILRKRPLKLFIQNILFHDVQNKQTNYTVVIGLRSMLWNDYRNY